jgi:WXG100 family type VII secretion target
MYSYDSAVARDSEGGLAATAASIEAHLDDLGGFVNAVSANWEGDEQLVYRGIQTRWDTAATQVREIVNQIRLALGQTTESVEDMRARVRATLEG